ncbi:MAG: HAMP domain-containing sensor histidine kinase [Synechococcaceae cyanobacterium]|nr:HAMP domain-containing sensor histidine kinase [Synechococcaceae cyanobacterium]
MSSTTTAASPPLSSWRQRLLGSLLAQLRLAAFAASFLVFCAATTTTLLVERQISALQLDEETRHSRLLLLEQMRSDEAQGSAASRERLQRSLNRTSSPLRLLWVRRGNGELVTPRGPLPAGGLTELAKRAAWAQDPDSHSKALLQPGAADSDIDPLSLHRIRVVPWRHEQFRTQVLASTPGGQSLWVAEDISDDVLLLRSELVMLLLAWVVCLVALLLASTWLTRRIMRPLRKLNGTASALTPANLSSSRIQIDQGPLEVRELAQGYNALLDRLGQSWTNQRDFVNAVSHELRNPLMIISGYLRRLLRRGRNLEPEQLDALNTVDLEIGRITRMLNDLLDLARSESGRLDLTVGPVPVDEILVSACDLSRSLLGRQLDLQLPAEAGQEPLLAIAEADRLQQVVLNLIENADKYSPPSSLVTVRLLRRPPRRLRITVRDRGIGIPAEDIPKIFDRFHRGRNAAEQGRGSGLGLSVVRLLVGAMGGTVSVESSLGSGSSFHIDLPAAGSSDLPASRC